MPGPPSADIRLPGCIHRTARIAVCVAAAALASVLTLAGSDIAPATIAILLFAGIASVILRRVEAYHPFPEFGPANLITLARAALACLLAAIVTTGSVALWLIAFPLALAALALDGVDGWAARRTAMASRFGARFDMEIDALLILVLSAAAWVGGKAGAWVLLLGLMRYAFLAASLAWPALGADLPASTRRKAICVVQVAVLALLLLPAIAPPLSTGLALGAFGALSWSFAVDVIALLRRAKAA